MAELLPKHQVALGDPVWIACVDNFLMKAVDIDSQVHTPSHPTPLPALFWRQLFPPLPLLSLLCMFRSDLPTVTKNNKRDITWACDHSK